MRVIIKKNRNKACPSLDTFPQGYFYNNKDEIVEVRKMDLIESIKKNNNYGTVTSRKNLKDTHAYLKKCQKLEKLNGAFIVECLDGTELVIINYNKNLYTSMFDNMQKSIVAGHKVHNASKDFKMRQAVGRDRVERFKILANGW
ncbi:MAG: hypothetical protein ACRC6E_06105 [Fusobacteriaceae bacterium]